MQRALATAVCACALVACTSTDAATERSVAPVTRAAPVVSTTAAAAIAPAAASPTTEPTTAPATSAPALAPDAATLARRIEAGETAVRAGTGDVAAAAFELQVLYRQLGRTPSWEPDVLAALPPGLADAAWANAAARREFRAMHRTLSSTLPAWRIIEPAPSAELLASYQEGEATFGVPWEILAAVNLVETGMGRIEGYSIAGARGPMQFMPGTWDAFGEGDIDDPHDAIMAAARYLAHNGGGRGDIDNALYRYNHSNRYVRGVKLYASIMEADPTTFLGFYHWRIVYLSDIGDVWLPVGFASPERIAVADYVAANPGHLLGTATN